MATTTVCNARNGLAPAGRNDGCLSGAVMNTTPIHTMLMVQDMVYKCISGATTNTICNNNVPANNMRNAAPPLLSTPTAIFIFTNRLLPATTAICLWLDITNNNSSSSTAPVYYNNNNGAVGGGSMMYQVLIRFIKCKYRILPTATTATATAVEAIIMHIIRRNEENVFVYVTRCHKKCVHIRKVINIRSFVSRIMYVRINYTSVQVRSYDLKKYFFVLKSMHTRIAKKFKKYERTRMHKIYEYSIYVNIRTRE